MLEENLKNVFEEIKNGNDRGEKITLVGATKTVPIEIINDAITLGLGCVAENKVQEFREKHGKLFFAEEQFIGHLQTNKVKYLVGEVSLIQSVDSIKLAEEINRVAEKKGVVQNVLLEINIGGELSKSGFTPLNGIDSVKIISNFSNVKVLGLMAMLPPSSDTEYLKNLCLQMRSIYDKLKSEGYPFCYLSIGMSEDYKIAIRNGSNMIRLGSALFGKRNYGEK